MESSGTATLSHRNIPADTTEVILEGGCHAGFGSYGTQKGDGTPTLTAEEQQQQTADALAQWMKQDS